MQRKLVMFVVDNPLRELRGVASIQAELAVYGIRSFVASKVSWGLDYDLYRPDVVVLPRIIGVMGNFAATGLHSSTRLCVVPVEHCLGQDLFITNFYGPTTPPTFHPAIERVDHFFLPGQRQKEILLENNVVAEDRLSVTGTLNSDHWMTHHSGRQRGQFVGVATTNKSLLFAGPVPSIMEVLDGGEDPLETMLRVDLCALEMAAARGMLAALDSIPDYPVSLRPHPHEYVGSWKRYCRQSRRRLSLNRTLFTEDWITNNFITVCSFSTMLFDSFAHGIPAVSLHKFVPKRFYDNQPEIRTVYCDDDLVWAPETPEAFATMVDDAYHGRLALSPKMDDVRQFMQQRFEYPRKEFACTQIADGIRTLLADSPSVRQSVKSTPHDASPCTLRQTLKRVLQRLPGGRVVLRWALYAYVLATNPRRENLYYPFRLVTRWNAWRYAKHLVHNLKPNLTASPIHDPGTGNNAQT